MISIEFSTSKINFSPPYIVWINGPLPWDFSIWIKWITLTQIRKEGQEINWNIDTINRTLQHKYEMYNKVLKYILSLHVK